MRLGPFTAVATCILLQVLSAPACLAQQRSLADLLLEAEEAEAANPKVPAAQPPQDPAASREAIRRLIQARCQIVGNADLFSTLSEIIAEEPKHLRLIQAAQIAARAQKAAKSELDIASGLARGGGPGSSEAAVSAAQSRLNDASQRLAAAQREAMDNYNSRLAPRYQRVSTALPTFFENYGRMRQLLTHSRHDPARDAILLELENGRGQCENFTEGHVLTGIMHTYAGKPAEAEAAFSQASDINMRHGLVFTPLGYDCCYGLILLGKADTLDEYIARLRKFPPKNQTFVCCWLIGAHSLSKRKYNDAATFLTKALAKSKGHASPQLRGEAALMHLLVENKVNVEKAKDLLDGLEDATAWQAQRANASLSAEEEDWTRAVALMDACMETAPPRFEQELEQQRSAYKTSEVWRLPPPNASRKK